MDPTQLTPETDEQKDIRLNKDLAAVSYFWIVSVAAYASRRDSKFVQFHSRQGIVLFLLSIPIYLIPFVGQYLVFFVLAGMLLGFINAAQGRYVDVPVAGPLSRGQWSWSDIKKGFEPLLAQFAAWRKKSQQTPAENAQTAQPHVDDKPSV